MTKLLLILLLSFPLLNCTQGDPKFEAISEMAALTFNGKTQGLLLLSSPTTVIHIEGECIKYINGVDVKVDGYNSKWVGTILNFMAQSRRHGSGRPLSTFSHSCGKEGLSTHNQ